MKRIRFTIVIVRKTITILQIAVALTVQIALSLTIMSVKLRNDGNNEFDKDRDDAHDLISL